HGFTTGVLNWSFGQAIRLFVKRFVIRRNKFDTVMDREEALGYNEGLIKGWAVGASVPEKLFSHRLNQEKKKAYRIALRRLANRPRPRPVVDERGHGPPSAEWLRHRVGGRWPPSRTDRAGIGCDRRHSGA